MGIVWTAGHILVITWGNSCHPTHIAWVQWSFGAVPLVPDFTPVSFYQAFTPSPWSGLILSPAADPIPYWLVQRIRSGEFVEMRDLLADNTALHDQLEDLHDHTTSLNPRLRELPSLASWVYCFAAYRQRI